MTAVFLTNRGQFGLSPFRGFEAFGRMTRHSDNARSRQRVAIRRDGEIRPVKRR